MKKCLHTMKKTAENHRRNDSAACWSRHELISKVSGFIWICTTIDSWSFWIYRKFLDVTSCDPRDVTSWMSVCETWPVIECLRRAALSAFCYSVRLPFQSLGVQSETGRKSYRLVHLDPGWGGSAKKDFSYVLPSFLPSWSSLTTKSGQLQCLDLH